MSAKLLLDGYNLDATVPASGPWPAVTFRYRPALSEEVLEHFAKTQNAPAKTVAAAIVALLAKHVIGWDVQNDKGEALPVTAEYLKLIPHRYQQGMLNHVLGYGDAQEAADVKN